jgi:hypothetical protein
MMGKLGRGGVAGASPGASTKPPTPLRYAEWGTLRGDLWGWQEVEIAEMEMLPKAFELLRLGRLWEGVADARIASLDVRRRTQVFEYERLTLAWRLHFPD